MNGPFRVLETGQAPWILAPHEMDLVLTAEHPPHSALVTAAFVLAFDADQRLLLTEVALPGRGWDLPGGHIDPGEQANVAAVRELVEETGFVASPEELSLAGWQRFTLLERPAASYPYPYPLSYMLLFTLRHVAPRPPVKPAADSECAAAQWCSPTLVERRCAGLSWFPFVDPVRAALFAGEVTVTDRGRARRTLVVKDPDGPMPEV